jgi:flagellar motor protein MotB
MLGKTLPKVRSKEEGEKPFWISYADLMTALMILFLVVMVASLLSVTKRIAIETQGEKDRAASIDTLCKQLELAARSKNRSIVVDCKDNRVNFGEAGRFGYNAYQLGIDGEHALRDVVPLILDAAEGQEGRKWFKQVVIEGFTDTDGSYLYNLHLSLQRSEWVMCALLDDRRKDATGLTDVQRGLVRDLFLAGGVSFNNAKASKDASRRVELRMQFYGLKEDRSAQPAPEFRITRPEVCQLS